MTFHSGGAIGTDSYFELQSSNYGFEIRAYSYKTNFHRSQNKVEISDSDYEEGIQMIKEANKILKRPGISKYMNLLARNWPQVKYAQTVIAVGRIIKPGEKNTKGYISKATMDTVDGGTGYACTMCILTRKPLYVYDQLVNDWFRWSYINECFIRCSTPILEEGVEEVAGIGTRELVQVGMDAIDHFFEINFKNKLKQVDNI